MRHLKNLEVDITPDILWTVMQDNCDVQSAEDDIFYRHSDHLGSASWITEHHGDAIQYLHYLPYGQLLANQMPYGYDERYKFTGKERDAETGYDYFGARYYAPSLLHWITVDPLADKYPHISPYAYCSWNPINRIDSDGKDDIEIQWNSDTESLNIKRIKNNDYDQVHIIDNAGNRNASSKQYLYGTIGQSHRRTYGGSEIYFFDVAGDDNASNLFEFLGSNFTNNNPLEWSRVQIGLSGKGRNIIGTSGKSSSTGVGQYILNKGYTIIGVDHNHPKGHDVSNADIKNAHYYHDKFPNAILRVYIGTIYYTYDGNGVISISNPLFEINATGKLR